MQLLEIGEEVIGGYEKGDLDDEAYGAAQGIGGMIVVLPVEGGEHHVLLVTLEGCLDPAYARLQADAYIALLLLQRLCYVV